VGVHGLTHAQLTTDGTLVDCLLYFSLSLALTHKHTHSCGRISCHKEGYDFCPFCGLAVEAPSAGTDAAWRHKERLLRFDRDSVQRMVVLDDSASESAAVTNSMAWLTEDERTAAQEQQAAHDRSLAQRSKIKLDLLL
jgi:uncharacterized Zn finger protein (UPF0148 family)